MFLSDSKRILVEEGLWKATPILGGYPRSFFAGGLMSYFMTPVEWKAPGMFTPLPHLWWKRLQNIAFS